jgi:hypothetical protein
MTCTIWGTAAAEHDVAATYTRSGYLAEAEAVDQIVEELPDNGVDVTVGHHGERLGQLIYGEIDGGGKLNVVAVLHDDTILSITSPIYFSPELLTVGPQARTRSTSIAWVGGLVALALTTDPATVAAQPIRVRQGDLRDAGHRSHWPLSWKGDAPLLARAFDSLGTRHRATRLERQRDDLPGHGWVDFDGQPVAGPLRHAAGRVLLGYTRPLVRPLLHYCSLDVAHGPPKSPDESS